MARSNILSVQILKSRREKRSRNEKPVEDTFPSRSTTPAILRRQNSSNQALIVRSVQISEEFELQTPVELSRNMKWWFSVSGTRSEKKSEKWRKLEVRMKNSGQNPFYIRNSEVRVRVAPVSASRTRVSVSCTVNLGHWFDPLRVASMGAGRTQVHRLVTAVIHLSSEQSRLFAGAGRTGYLLFPENDKIGCESHPPVRVALGNYYFWKMINLGASRIHQCGSHSIMIFPVLLFWP